MEIKTQIGPAEFKLTSDVDIAAMDKNHRTRALKLIDSFRAAGENGAPKERRTRKPRQRGESAIEQAAGEAGK
jgi:hypothetical protein